jgi:alpha-glucosidase
MPWDRPETWDTELQASYVRLIGLRRSSDALARGGLRYVSVGDDAIVYLREHGDERLLCLAARAEHEQVRVPLAALGCRALETLLGTDATCAGGIATLPHHGPAFHVWRLDS